MPRDIPAGTEDNLLTKTCFLAGRAVRIGENGALAAARAPVVLAAWTGRRVVSSARLLVPFRRRRGTGGRRPPRSAPVRPGEPGRAVSSPGAARVAASADLPPARPVAAAEHVDALRRLRAELAGVDPAREITMVKVVAGLETLLHRLADSAPAVSRILKAALDVLLGVGRGEIADAGEAVSDVARALDAAERRLSSGPEREPSDPAKAPRGTSAPVAVRERPPPEVTQSEAADAAFGGAREKLVFHMALEDMIRPDQAARTRSVHALAGIRHPLSSRAIAARLVRDCSAEVRRECVTALTGLGGKDALPAIERALSDASEGVRLAAVRGVYRLAGPEGAPLLVRMFADEHEDVRRRAAACAGWLGQEHLAAALIPLLSDESAFVRGAALDALVNLKSTQAVDEIIDLLNDPEEPVARRASEALEAITGRKMAGDFPEDEHGRQLLIARWRARKEAMPWLPKG